MLFLLGENKMNEKEFLSLCSKEVIKYINEHLDKSDKQEIT